MPVGYGEPVQQSQIYERGGSSNSADVFCFAAAQIKRPWT